MPRPEAAEDEPSGAEFAGNLIGFARLLRRAGLPVGPAESLAAAEALSITGIAERDTVRAALRATLQHAHDHHEVFDGAFDLWWRAPGLPLGGGEAGTEATERLPAARRLAEALAANRDPAGGEREDKPEEASLSVSAAERLGQLDFEAMSAEEIAAAKREIRRLALPLAARPTRRFRPDPHGPRSDLRATVRASLRRGGEILAIERRRRMERPPPLVAICDISGSMARYAQVLVHFLHAVTNDRDRVHTFLFGTRLTNVTRQLRHRDPEVAFQMVGRTAPDWSGGTRIGEALEHFNRDWARRVLGQGAVVLLITDGLDRAGGEGLGEAAERLAHSCRRLIWLNPLLRYAGFQPRSQGIRALLPHVHEHRPVHNLDSLRALVEALSAQGGSSGGPPRDAAPRKARPRRPA
ncbi:VWA domain-containing protein [Roseomonas mucosa]|uniref:vWA domain-containing protein n=1 Tax=Roseomonas mucosa TaxID=207340 RepID=UPI0028CDA3F9|nr:VWA domain-containing protein [Roseomonas mucosa]MDT8277818.1 VWA domain-containing protein [Roseomonas mucosa]MDT8353680.1 VWA domain-containing protein [Roseomonas mucosa]